MTHHSFLSEGPLILFSTPHTLSPRFCGYEFLYFPLSRVRTFLIYIFISIPSKCELLLSKIWVTWLCSLSDQLLLQSSSKREPSGSQSLWPFPYLKIWAPLAQCARSPCFGLDIPVNIRTSEKIRDGVLGCLGDMG